MARIICWSSLNLELIRAHAKPFFAYSDLTGIQLHLLDRIGLPAFHGPMLAADFNLEDGVHLPSFTAALAGELQRWRRGRIADAEGRHARAACSMAAASASWFRCWARNGSRAPRASCYFWKTWARSRTRWTGCCGNCARRGSLRA